MLEVKAIDTYRGPAHILHGVSLEVGAREVVCLVGRNGAGKTTTIESIMGFLPVRSGEIVFEGRSLNRLPPHQRARRGIGYSPEDCGVFPELTVDLYKSVLRRMAHPEAKLIEQAPDGTLLPGEEGERVIEGRDFYAAFQSPEEFKVVTDRGRAIGMVPATNPFVPQQLIVFGGRRWRVLEVDLGRREILVTPAHGGRPPVFGGDALPPADGVVAEMRRVSAGREVPAYLDAQAQGFLAEGRATFARLRLGERSACRHDGNVLLFPWVGTRGQSGLLMSLVRRIGRWQ